MLREEHGLRWQLYRHGALVACGCIRETDDPRDDAPRLDGVIALARILAADLHLP